MKKNLEAISTVNMSREDWLMHRKNSIGGSDAAAVVGLSNWSSPYSVWAEKTGKLAEIEDNEAMRVGRDLEQYVAERFCEATGKKVRRRNAILRDPDIPFAHANVDRLIVGEDAGLECKTTSVLNMKAFDGGEYPANYYVQCMHYMMVTGASKWYLAVLVMGRQFLWFEIERNEDEIAALRAQEEAFWNHVITNTPPEIDGSQATADALNDIYGHDNGYDGVDLSAVSGDLLLLSQYKKQQKALKEDIAGCENRIKAFLGAATGGRYDNLKVSWKEQARRTFDVERFQRETGMNPEPWYKTSSSRVFKFTETKRK